MNNPTWRAGGYRGVRIRREIPEDGVGGFRAA